MKCTNLKSFICGTFSQIKQRVPKKILKMRVRSKIVTAIAVISGLITIFVFFTGISWIGDIVLPETVVEDITAEDKSDKNKDINRVDAKSTKELIMSQSAFRKELEHAIGSDMCIVVDFYNDFNDDEDCEMFALVTTQKEKKLCILL